MKGTMKALRSLFMLTVLVGCPLTDDPQADEGEEVNVDPGKDKDSKGGKGSGAESELDAGNDGDHTGADAGGQGPDDEGPTAPEEDAGGRPGADGDDAPDPDPDPGSDDSGDGDNDGSDDNGDEEPDAGSEPVAPDFGPADMNDDDRAALIYDLVKSENFTETYAPFFEEHAEIRPVVVSSHGGIVRVFQNEIARRTSEAWVQQNFPLPLKYPHGSIIVKETFKTDPDTQALTLSGAVIMAKIDGLDPSAYEGNWFYVRISSSGAASYSASCVNCHNGRTATGLWPKTPENEAGGKADAIVPYDYLFVAFCRDPRNPECNAP